MSVQFTEVLRVSPKFDQNVLESILKKAFKLKEVTITNIEVDAASKKGDSYLSTVCRFKIEGNSSNSQNDAEKVCLRIITKGLPKNLARRKTFRSVDFFSDEVIFYNTVWPALTEFQNTKNVKLFNNIPECYYAVADGTNDIVVLEDVSYQDFRGVTRSSALDLNHTIMIVKLFARFHGISLAFKDQFPEKFEEIANSLQETYFCEKYRGWYQNFQKNLLALVRDAVEKQLPEMYLKKFDEIMSIDLFGESCKLCERRGKFAVIAHGDAWIPNFLVKYDNSGSPLEAFMIDFQLARCSSLAQDILFFVYNSTTQELRDQYWDFIINEYYVEIADVVSKLGSPDIITLKDIQQELKENALFGIAMSFESVTMSLLEDSETADIDELQGDDIYPLEVVWVLHPFKSADKRQRLADLFKDVIDRGYL